MSTTGRTAALIAKTLALALIALPTDPTFAAEPPMKNLTFQSGPAPWPRGDFRFWLSSGNTVGQGRDQKVVARAALLCYERSGFGGEVDYPDLLVGDVLPACGYLYRVTNIADNGRPKGTRGSDFMEVTWFEPKDYPKGLTFQEGSFAIPAPVTDGGPGSAVAHGANLYIKKITPSKKEGEPPTAEIEVGVTQGAFYVRTTARVRPGDLLTIDKAQHKVRNVVPRDEKTHVIGWVELDPEFTTLPAEPKK